MANAAEYLSLLVRIATKHYEDGTPFFDFVDQKIAHPTFFNYFRDRILDDGLRTDAILTSGKFGWAFSAYAMFMPVLPQVLNFPGNLRHEPLRDPWVDPSFVGKEFVFIDNSIYKGRTLGKIEEYVERWGGRINRAYVAYDGSRPHHDWTDRGYPTAYLYRWHDGGFRP